MNNNERYTSTVVGFFADMWLAHYLAKVLGCFGILIMFILFLVLGPSSIPVFECAVFAAIGVFIIVLLINYFRNESARKKRTYDEFNN